LLKLIFTHSFRYTAKDTTLDISIVWILLILIYAVCCWQVAEDIAELNRLCQLTTRPYVKQLLQTEVERLHQSSVSSVEAADSGLPQTSADTDSSCTDAVAASTDTTTPQSAGVKDVSAAVSNPCIAVVRSAPQRYYKEINTYGES